MSAPDQKPAEAVVTRIDADDGTFTVTTPMSDGRLMAAIAVLGVRFTGVELRRGWPNGGWPKPWRARLITHKNQRAEYRCTKFADTWQDAALAVIAHVAKMDGAP